MLVGGCDILAPSAEVELKKAAGAHWNGARGELMTAALEGIAEAYAIYDLPGDVRQKMAECTVDRTIAFLNRSDCNYLYNPGFTTEAEHLAGQEACLQKIHYDKVREGFDLECARLHFPDDWTRMARFITDDFISWYGEQGVEQAQAKVFAACFAREIPALMAARKHPLVNRKAKTIDDLLYSVEKWVPDYSKDEEYQQIFTRCGPKEEPAAD